MAESNAHPDNEQRQTVLPGGGGAEGIGMQLQNQRKAKGISIIEVAEHTKIGRKYLEAIENERFEELPGETYIRGFLRAYAKYLELDEVALARQYLDERRGPVPGEGENREPASGEGEGGGPALWVPLLSVLVLAALGAGLFWLWPGGGEREARSDPAAIENQLAAPLPPALPAAGDLTLKVRAKVRTWITLMVDGRQGPDITLQPGEERTWTAKERFVLWTGNAGGIEVYFNGVLQPPLGEMGEVRKEVIYEHQPAGLPAPELE